MTTINDARKTIYNEFISQWGNTSAFTVGNEPFNQPENDPWVRLVVRNRTGGQRTLGRKGNRRFDRHGAIIAQVFIP